MRKPKSCKEAMAFLFALWYNGKKSPNLMGSPAPSTGTDLSHEEQVRLGQSKAQKMDPKHEAFMVEILRKIDVKEIDMANPRSIINTSVYSALTETEQGQADIALINIFHLLGRIVEFRISKQTPDESPELQSMIEHLRQMKERAEERHDIFTI